MRALGHGVPSERIVLEESMAVVRGQGKLVKRFVTIRPFTESSVIRSGFPHRDLLGFRQRYDAF